jgi:hypothetical protein
VPPFSPPPYPLRPLATPAQFFLFTAGIPCLFINLIVAGMVKFWTEETRASWGVMIALMGLFLLGFFHIQRSWAEFLLTRETGGSGNGWATNNTPFLAHTMPWSWHAPQAAGGAGEASLLVGGGFEGPDGGGGAGVGQGMKAAAVPVAESEGRRSIYVDVEETLRGSQSSEGGRGEGARP